MIEVAGVDGCRGGWLVVTDGGAFVCSDFAAVLGALSGDAVVAVDIPIGLLDGYEPGGREADKAARALLGRRGVTVFPAPPRKAFGATTLREVQARGCRMTMQALMIMPKIEDVDAVMTPELQGRIYEVHPEVSFSAMNAGAPVMSKKARRTGRDERRRLLEGHGIVVPERPREGEAEDDLLDACAARWSAHRITRGAGCRVPEDPPVDSRGLPMEIWW